MTRKTRATSEFLGECLAAAGVTRVFGPVGLPGLGHVAVDDPDLAVLLADADGRLHRTGAALLPDGRLRLAAAPGLAAEPHRITEVGDIPGAVAAADSDVPTAVELQLDLDLDAPAPRALEPMFRGINAVGISVNPEQRMVVLAGPGVLRSGMLEKLQRFAAEAGVGVVNTWGAKGVFRWDSPHHLGTAGLQERDFELAGLGEAELVVATGVDLLEAPLDLLPEVDIVNVHLWNLIWDPADFPSRDIPRPPLYKELAAVVGPAYEDESVPLHPARAARQLGEMVPPGGLVVADPGPAGFWIARTFPTIEPGSVIVPATRAPGFAAAAALVSALDERPAVAVTTAPVNPPTAAVVDLARSLDFPLTLQAWGEDPEVDFSRTRDLVEVAGPVTAWTQ